MRVCRGMGLGADVLNAMLARRERDTPEQNETDPDRCTRRSHVTSARRSSVAGAWMVDVIDVMVGVVGLADQ